MSLNYLMGVAAGKREAYDRMIHEKMKRIRHGRGAAAVDTAERVRELEDGLARVTLLARALASLCLRKGLITDDELMAITDELDLSDGVADGKLSSNSPPRAFANAREPGEAADPKEYLQHLERGQRNETPEDFLKNLEDQE